MAKTTTTKFNLFKALNNATKMDSLFQSGLPVRYIPYILYITLLGIIYIGNSHYSDRMAKKTNTVKKDVEDLRADYTTLKARYMIESKQSIISEKVEPMGLRESNEPPVKIEINE